MRPPRDGGRPAAVLLLFGDGPNGPDILLIQRSSRGRNHAASPPSPVAGSTPTTTVPSARPCVRRPRRRASTPRASRSSGPCRSSISPHSDNRVTPVIGWWHTPVPSTPPHPTRSSRSNAFRSPSWSTPPTGSSCVIQRVPRPRLPRARAAGLGLHRRESSTGSSPPVVSRSRGTGHGSRTCPLTS